jgi:DNA-binding MarR family transcriptional regulator
MSQINEVLTALRRVIRAADIHSKRLSKTVGLTAPQLLLMQAIRNNQHDSTIGTLANQISLSQATVNNIIGRLESRGLITRQRSQSDKRYVWLHLTTEGNKTLDRAPTPLHEQFVERFDQLENWEQNMILSSLQRLATMMGAEEIDASPILDIGPLDRESGE